MPSPEELDSLLPLSTRIKCPDCDENRVRKALEVDLPHNGSYICGHCGVVFKEETDVVVAKVYARKFPCPHCHSVEDIRIAGGMEWCSYCGLDPNETEYPSKQISHLWRTEALEKDDKLISDMLKKGRFTPDSYEGKFLRTECGPHCATAKVCPQTTQVFSHCYREELDLTGMGKRKRRRNSSKAEKKRARKEEKARMRAAANQTMTSYEFAEGGWYEKVMYANKTTDNGDVED